MFAFILSFLYWGYLASTTQMIIMHDAQGFQTIGASLRESGLRACLTQNSREPIYPTIIALSIVLGEILSAHAQSIQVVLQLLLLFLSQWFVFLILKKLGVRRCIQAGAIVYIGISPALVNAALSSFSEITTLPLSAGILLVNLMVLQRVRDKRTKDVFLLGGLLGILFALMAFVKAAYEFIFFVFLFSYMIAFLIFVFQKKNKLSMSIGVFMLSFVLAFQSLVLSYKWMKKNNGHSFSIVKGRGAYVLYNSAALRAEKITLKKILSLAVYTIGPGYCNDVFGIEECSFWNTGNLEEFMHKEEIQKKLREANSEESNRILKEAAIKKIKKHPFQFSLLMGMDALRLFFWESTRIGFVVYPHWLEQVFGNQIFKFMIRALMGFCSFFAVLFWVLDIFRKRKKLFALEEQEGLGATYFAFILIIIFSHVGLYAFVGAAVARHALPLAPLYLILIAVCINKLSVFNNRE